MKIWRLSSPESGRGHAEWDGSVDLAGVVCPANEGHRRAGKRLNDLGVLLTENPVSDLTWTWYSELLLRDNVITLFEENNVTGYDLRPVRARFKLRSDEAKHGRSNRGFSRVRAQFSTVPRLHELGITGWAGVAPPESGVRLEYECKACGQLRYTGFTNPKALFDESQWDGSDIFMIWPMPKFVFVTDRVANIVRRNKLKRCQLIPIEELAMGSSGFGPGRLHYYFSEERSRAIGGPLGIY